MLKSFERIQAEADQLVRVWNANPAFALDNVTLEAFQSLVASFNNARSATEDLRTQLVKSVNEFRKITDALTDTVARVRTSIRGFFGPDSPQYEQIGGKRASQRRPRKPKAAPAPAAA